MRGFMAGTQRGELAWEEGQCWQTDGQINDGAEWEPARACLEEVGDGKRCVLGGGLGKRRLASDESAETEIIRRGCIRDTKEPALCTPDSCN